MQLTNYVYAIIASLIFSNLQAQQPTLVDTMNIQYRKMLLSDYALRSAKVENDFATLPDKQIRTKTLKVFKARKKEVEEQINKGVFYGNNPYLTLLNSQLETIQHANPAHKKINQIQVLLATAETTNASASIEGYIVFNLPMFLKANNEFTIAYILCHEIAHYLLNHSYNSIVASAELNTSAEIKDKTTSIKKNKYNKGKLASELFRQIVYDDRKTNRAIELQADSLGFVLFSKAFPTAKSEAMNTLLWLSEIDKENDSISIKNFQKFISTPSQPFKLKWLKNDEFSDYRYDSTPKFWTIDSLKTHPDCEIRAEEMTRLFKIENKKSTQASDQFATLQKTSQFDYINSLHHLKSYGMALYHCLLHMQTKPEDPWLKQATANNLQKLQEFQNMYRLNDVLEIPDPNYSTSYNTFLHLIRELRKSELTELISHYKSI